MSSKGVIWLEALTPKQALLFATLASELEKKRVFTCVISTREYELTTGVLELFHTRYIAIGSYGGGTLEGKLRASIERQVELFNWIIQSAWRPRVHVAFTSPDSSRVAFGLGIPIVEVTDSPHSEKVNRLTLPLADRVVAPLCVAEGVSKFLPTKSVLRTFDGVFEVAWVKRLRPKVDVIKALGLSPMEYYIVRLPETKAAYYSFNARLEEYIKLIKKLSSTLKVVIYPRYQEQRALARELARRERGVILLERAVDMLSLEYYAVFVLTGGSTIAQEAALLGTPAVVTFPRELPTVRFLSQRGFPIYHEPCAFLDLCLSIAKDPDSFRGKSQELLKKVEDPLPVLEQCIIELAGSC